MEADDQRVLCHFRLQIFRYENIDADGVLVDGFVAGAVDVEGGELLRIQGCG